MVDIRTRQKIRRNLGYKDALIKGRLATDSIGPYASRVGYVRVEQQKGPNTYLPAVEALNETQASDPGVLVLMREEGDELVVVRVDTQGEVARGANPMVTGGQNQDAFGYISSGDITEFRTTPVSPVTTEVYIWPGFLPNGRYFTGYRTTTLTAAIAALSNDYHQLAMTYVTAGGSGSVVFATEQSLSDPFDTTDLLECLQQVPPGSVLSKTIELIEGQTEISDSAFQYDLRGPAIAYQRIANLQTTDDTPTVPDGGSVDVAEGDTVYVKAIVTGAINDLSAALTAVVQGGYRRATGGNVTLIGSLDSVLNEDSGSSPTVTLTANTSDQTVDVTITGVAAETWNWRVKLETEYNS